MPFISIKFNEVSAALQLCELWAFLVAHNFEHFYFGSRYFVEYFTINLLKAIFSAVEEIWANTPSDITTCTLYINNLKFAQFN